MNTFESISLDKSVAARVSDPLESSSDDGLDPNDFLSHGVSNSVPPEQHTLDNSIDLPTLLPSEELDTSAVFDSLHSSIYNLEGFTPPNLDKVQVAQTDSTIRYLRSRHDGFVSDMSTAIGAHMRLLNEGEDCSSIRNFTIGLFNQLSDNCLEQCEIYNRELTSTRHSLVYFQNLDHQRSKVLRRIKSIKSEKNEFGAKLDSLLAQRTSIDEEIAGLESRLQALQAKRNTVSVEIDGTISVLESKSSKYVNYFRHLETSGKSAIVDYLASSSLPDESIATYLKTEKVTTLFNSTNHTVTPENEVPKSNTLNEPSASVPKPAEMGIQALEIPPEIPKIEPKLSSLAYEKGYDTASKQLETIKKGVSHLVHAFKNSGLDSMQQKPSRKLDDTSNTITEKLDFTPILQLLNSKIDTLKQFEIQSSKAAQLYRMHSATWLDVCKFLEKQESALFSVISTTKGGLSATANLKNILTNSDRLLEDHIKTGSSPEKSSNYLQILLQQEHSVVKSALSRLSESEVDKNESQGSEAVESVGTYMIEKTEKSD